eukprot:CAMPEP_0182539560 /NCGR_PEP_ID=MMETSP1323-20130603/25590_1 /TAXON_ID=236787 /ORGANISM="Florenciella parvula, Strain RCC1693" /LENGTH=84 /DNA_ID=CAMNT_0024750137 /DNA_START=104 /DNA_END=354 /DNA_ORIENTATION=+
MDLGHGLLSHVGARFLRAFGVLRQLWTPDDATQAGHVPPQFKLQAAFPPPSRRPVESEASSVKQLSDRRSTPSVPSPPPPPPPP